MNAGGGNLGVTVVRLLGLLVIAVAGAAHPRLPLALYVPLILLATWGAVRRMDNLATVRNDTGAARQVLADRQTWLLSFLYLGTFGSFLGYGFPFGLVLQHQFDRSPLQAASLTLVGPLLGSLSRPVGGALAGRHGGARVTWVNFLLMAVATLGVVVDSVSGSLALFLVSLVALFVLTGVGNGSTYRMIPGVFRVRAAARGLVGGPPTATAGG